MWTGYIGKVTTAGVITEYRIPAPGAISSYAVGGIASLGITTGSDGALWFTEASGNKIGRLIVDDTRPIVTFTEPTSFAGPFSPGPVVTINASDANGLSSMVIHVYTSANVLLTTCGSATPSELAAGSKSCDLSGLPNGNYYIKAGAFYVPGNNRTINSGVFTIGS